MGSLGNGAHASIFTQDQTNGEQLAIKKFPDTPFGRNCFYNECIIFNKLKRKQNNAKVVSICGDSLSIAMKRYQCDLFTLAFEQEKLQIESIQTIFRDICNGVYNLHRAGIAHLDIKPENILIDEKKKKAFLCDFSASYIQKPFERKAPVATQKVGTVEYMAPEVNLGRYNPFAADIYSLGCLLYVLCTGHFPSFNVSGFLIPCRPMLTTCKSLVYQLLYPNPTNRPSIEQVLKHPFVADSLRHKMKRLACRVNTQKMNV